MAFVNVMYSTFIKSVYFLLFYLTALITSQSASSAILDKVESGSHIAKEIVKLFNPNNAKISMTKLFSSKYILCFTINSINPRSEALRIFPNATVSFDESGDSNRWHIIKYNTIKKDLCIYSINENYIKWNIERNDNPVEIDNFDTTCTNVIELYKVNKNYYLNPVKE